MRVQPVSKEALIFINYLHDITGVTDEFVVELTNSSLPMASPDDAFIMAAEGNKTCFAYRDIAEAQ